MRWSKNFAIGGLSVLLLSACVTTQDGEEATVREPLQASGEELNIYASPGIRPGVRPALSTPEAGYWMQVDKIENQIKTAGNRVRDPELNAYVSDLVCKLAGPYCGDIRVYVMRVPAFNASMMPNGTMQVWTGLLLRVRNEAQLSAVLGHEIGHYLRRHTADRMRDAIEKTNGLIFFQMAVAGASAYAGVPNAGNLAALMVYSSIYAFGRDHEREADRFGMRLMVESGYDPREMAKVWRQLIRERDADEDNESGFSFFATHPSPEERNETLTRLAGDAIKNGAKTNMGSERFDAVVLPRRAQMLRDELNLRRHASFAELLGELIEGGKNVGELKYFQGELHRLRDDEGDREKALAFYLGAIKAGQTPPEVHRSLGQIYMRDKALVKAKASFRKYLELKPNAEDALMVRHMVRQGS